tara:strand:+ start:229 stop:3081 length:2853 start_codon:yes stop_codon:yes gene_type:complete
MTWAVFLGSSVNGDLLVEEEFDYNPGENIHNQSGGLGFDGPWVSTISHGRIYDIQATGLSFSTLRVKGNSVSRFGASGRAQAHRPLLGATQTALTGDNTTAWFSVLFKAPSAHRYAAFLFGTGPFTTSGSPILATAGDGFGFTLVAADGTSDGSGEINALAFDNATAPTVVTSTYNPGTATSLLVGKINWKPNGTPDEFFLFNVTDLENEPAENTAIVSITHLDFDQSAIDTIAIWDTNNAVTDEIRLATSFSGAMGTLPDSDGDGMSDQFERAHTNPESATALDPDEDLENEGAGDGLTNLQEFQHKTDPNDSDSDDDTLTDGAEVAGVGSRPPTNPAKADSDDDTLDDLAETNTGTIVDLSNTGTNPVLADTDLDGIDDGVETVAYLAAPSTASNPLMADTDADGAGDWYEIAASFTDPVDPTKRPNIPYPLPAPDTSAGDTNKPIKVYIMSGQSNMVAFGRVAGLAQGTLEHMTTQQNKFPNLIDGNGAWKPRNDVRYRGVISAIGNGPLIPGYGASAASFGPELGFGHVMGWYHDEPVLLIKASIGNRSLGWDCLPPGSASFVSSDTNYAGYGNYGNWSVGGNPPTSGTWYAGKQYDDYFLAESDMGATGWADTIAYPVNCQVHHNGVVYISNAAHTASPITEPGIGAQSAVNWDVYSVFNVTDVLDNFADEYPQYATHGFEIAGYVWWQGHKDQYDAAHYSRYEDNMVNFIKSIRDYYEGRYPSNSVQDAPFVLATVGFGGWSLSGGLLDVADGQLAVSGETGNHPEFAGNVKTIESRGYWRDFGPNTGEGHHYNHNAETYLLTGDALGRGMVELLSAAAPADYNLWASGFPNMYLVNPDAHDNDNPLSNNELRIWGIDPTSGGSASPITVPLDASRTFTYTRRDDTLTGLNYEIWTSTDLENWSKDTLASQAPETAVANVETVTVTLGASSADGRLFVQVRAVE